MDSPQAGNDNKNGLLDTAHARHEVQVVFDTVGAHAAYLKLIEEVNTFKKTNHDFTDQTVFAGVVGDGDFKNEQITGQIQMEWMRANFSKIAGNGKNEITQSEMVAFAKGVKDPIDQAMVNDFVSLGSGDVNTLFENIAEQSGSRKTIERTDVTLQESRRGPIADMLMEGDLLGYAQQLLEDRNYAPKNGFLTIPSINEQLTKADLPEDYREGLQYVKDNFDTLDHARFDFMLYSRGVNGKDVEERLKQLDRSEGEMRRFISSVRWRDRGPSSETEPAPPPGY